MGTVCIHCYHTLLPYTVTVQLIAMVYTPLLLRTLPQGHAIFNCFHLQWVVVR